MDIIERKLDSLSKSKFRSSFKLNDNDKKYVLDKGIEKIREHAYDFINKRLAGINIFNDGRQTPVRGHPVFIAQHATACCCRGCLYKWHHIEKDRDMSEREIKFVVALIMEWIKKNS